MMFLGKKISGMFTIPSGIITTDVKAISMIAKSIPEIGIITTKSIGSLPREGNKEPIITQYAPFSFMNAVGLTNPGADEFVRQLKSLRLPEDKFLLVSIFGGSKEEFVEVAKKLAPFADGLELNLSCPHAEGLGMAIGQDPVLVREITSAVKKSVDIPVIPKLTPNTKDIGAIARAAEVGGADAICAINTAGPGDHKAHGYFVLSNEKGGMSGKGIFHLGLTCIKEIRQAVSIPIIGCGGISSAQDVRAYLEAGASVVGIGSALAGMSTQKIKMFFSELNCYNSTENAAVLLPVDMSYKKFRVVENIMQAEDFSVLVLDKSYDVQPGQFVFVWIPGVGEKPFSVLDTNPCTLAVQKAGCFTKHLIMLNKGDALFLRGPYGNPVPLSASKAVLVGGGSGYASLYHIARELSRNGASVDVLIGARDKHHLFYTEQTSKLARVHIATEDGSAGAKGYVTKLFSRIAVDKEKVFFNCGPMQMITAVEPLEHGAGNIYSSIEYVTKCGIGLCGSCATGSGERLCVDGPFFRRKS